MRDIKEITMKKYKIIALIGKAGSGKDTLLHQVMKENTDFSEIISCTTRPPREGEVGGINYHFYTTEMFQEAESTGKMLESTYFKGWHYGTAIESLNKDKINIGVFNPAGIHSLLKHPDVEVLKVYYINASGKVRLLRQLNREINPDTDEIIRRYSVDENDFSILNFEYEELINEASPDLITNAKRIAHWNESQEALDKSN